MNAVWHALANEAGSAAEHLGVGATALGRANYAQRAYYAQAFFALSVGLERGCKLSLVVDHALEHEGKYPSNEQVKRYGHDLSSLLEAADGVAGRREIEPERRLPKSDIHDGIVGTLSNFATNLTRYYNLDLVTDAAEVEDRVDPIVEWLQRVTEPVLALHYPQRSLRRNLSRAMAIEEMVGPYMLVRFFAEDGTPIQTAGAASLRTAETEFARRWERMYVLQLARFVGAVLAELGFQAQVTGFEDIPYFSEFFSLFHNSDAYFRNRKTWSIH
ncbi:MAG TPA: hypothetical protein VG898_01005 [Solirubrobacterales bacterium]|nr:hypothetical protein [Solirubrobacterales bacterium]